MLLAQALSIVTDVKVAEDIGQQPILMPCVKVGALNDSEAVPACLREFIRRTTAAMAAGPIILLVLEF